MNTLPDATQNTPALKPSCVAVPRQTERETCGRCGGTGKYPSSLYHGVCLGCSGRGYKFTKRGIEAERYLFALRAKPASLLKVGDVVRERFGMAGQVTAFATITKLEQITEANATSWNISPEGVKTANNLGGFSVTLEHAKYGTLGTSWAAGEMIRVAQSAEQKLATLNQALDYQDTLTKQGKPRKTAATK